MDATDLSRPKPGSKLARVWDIADELVEALGRLPKGREVAEHYSAEGGNRNTAMTQYSCWRAWYLADQERPRTSGGYLTARLTVAANGQLVLPPEMRRAMKLDASGAVVALFADGELRLSAPNAALARAQALVKTFAKGKGSPVDELIRERREEASR